MPLDPPNDLDTQLNDLVSDWTGCTDCKLHKSRDYQVWWRIHGAQESRSNSMMIIGESPGEQESLQGVPFVGRSGKLLDKLLERSEVPHATITNTVCCHPPNNRDPTRGELKACWPRLQRMIKILQPKVLVSVGRVPSQWLLEKNVTIGSLVEKTYRWSLGDFHSRVVPMYHPAYLLRQNSKQLENRMIERFRLAKGSL
jgi:DNA polymerase